MRCAPILICFIHKSAAHAMRCADCMCDVVLPLVCVLGLRSLCVEHLSAIAHRHAFDGKAKRRASGGASPGRGSVRDVRSEDNVLGTGEGSDHQ